ncbi:uroporphyrinogen-III synthase [Kineosporia sp. R_H_3]|uniref:uroporphyrinogen-III synthase n=1 Tax=Kineosporia sp. R_H_3 TaxID=1961848 RepID=UPI000B4AFD1C|nr:uroporphyrinogen-III synthase [Kineosporia sp. R_H_3]
MSSTRTRKKTSVGQVSFVGAGPGDEGLLTLRAVERLAEASTVVVDQTDRERLVATRCPEDVEIVDAGFGEDGQPMTRAARAKIVVRAAKKGGRVVRLMDGDPATFTGLAEEIAACRKEGIGFEIVPGVSAATAVPAYAGIPLTPAGTSSVHVVHPHGVTVDWALHADAQSSVVVLGGVDEIVDAAAGLLRAGRAGSTPVAVTSKGTTTEQRTVSCTLAEVAKAVPAARLERPVTAVVGAAAGLREVGAWFETKPLFGWRVLVPRTKQQAGSMVSRLTEHGATAEVVPTISVEPPRTPHQIEKAVKGLVTGRYEWIGFTSVNAVRAIREKFEEFGLDARAFAGLKVAAVGGVTAEALREWGIEPDLVPSGETEQSAQGLLDIWPPFDEVLDPIDRVFLPRADIATDTLVAGLQAGGWEVDDVTAYRTVRAAPPAADVREAIKTGQFDAVVFTSSSTVRNLVGIAGKPHPTTIVACIGPATAKTAEEHGLRVDVLAPEPNTEALVQALAEYGTGVRLSAVEAGEPVLRPSQRKGAARRTAK